MQPVLVSTLLEQVRDESDLRNDQFFTDTDLCRMLTEANQELHDTIQKANEHHLMSSFDFTLTGGPGVGADTVNLPDDFIQGHTVEGNCQDPAPENHWPIHPLPSWLTRHRYKQAYRPLYFFRGRELVMYPSGRAAGSYRLWYTARADVLAEPTVSTFAITAPDNPNIGTPGPGGWSFANGNFGQSVPGTGTLVFETDIPVDETASIDIAFTGLNVGFNGVYFINGVNSATQISTTVNPGGVFTGPAAGTATLTYQPTGTTDRLPDTVVPYSRFVKLHTIVAVRKGRDMDASDQVDELEKCRAMVIASVTNRQEEPVQPPLQNSQYQDLDMIGNWAEWNG